MTNTKSEVCANPKCTNPKNSHGPTCGQAKCRQAVSRMNAKAKAKPIVKECKCCGENYIAAHKDSRFCSYTCQEKAANAERSDTCFKQYSREAFATAKELGDDYYSTRPQDREQFIISYIEAARHNSRIRRALTAPDLANPDLDNKHLFPRQCPNQYRTIAEIASLYALDCTGKTLSQLIKSSEQLEVQGYDMIMFDNRYWYKSIANLVAASKERKAQ